MIYQKKMISIHFIIHFSIIFFSTKKKALSINKFKLLIISILYKYTIFKRL
jgi:hypothetical protein